MPSQYPTRSDPKSPSARLPSSSRPGMAATHLTSSEHRSLPSPAAAAHQGRPVLPPIYPYAASGANVLPGHTRYPPGRPTVTSQPQGQAPPLQYDQNRYRNPPLIPWEARLVSERSSSHQQNRPIGFENAQARATSSAQTPYSNSAYSDVPRPPAESVRAPQQPSSLRPAMKLPVAEPARDMASAAARATGGVPNLPHQSSQAAASAYGSVPPNSARPEALAALQPGDITSRYILNVRQQPVAARACGFGERDRRVIDPPPIVQLSLANYDPASPEDVAELKNSSLVVHCTLLSSPTTSSRTSPLQDVTAVPDPNGTGRLTRKLTGTLVASPFSGTDLEAPPSRNENAKLSCFFIFSDLSCRQVGRYRLKFTIMKLGPQMLVPGGHTPAIRAVETADFEVFSAKDFPGMRASTALIRDLKRQGASVSVKKGNEGSARRSNRRRGSSPSEDSEDERAQGRFRRAG